MNREEGHKLIEKRAPAKLPREQGDPSVAAAAPQGNPGIPSNSSRKFIASLIRDVAILLTTESWDPESRWNPGSTVTVTAALVGLTSEMPFMKSRRHTP